mmetsp:Transcript_11475/g.31728  ORF Transcript_11475/g.31728 Transcript_11475/m.31728 type:complete len:358 (-) Transcript_11475:63-1136(-)
MGSGNFDDKVHKCIPAEFFMISSSQDSEISNEAYNTGSFELPDPAGKAGGACTSAILEVFYSRGHEVGQGMSWVDVLKDMHEQLKKQKFDQVPQLSSSRWIDVNQPMFIVPPKSGVRRAMLIGINYVGQKGQLKACHNDVENVKDYLIKAQGFRESEMLILKDDGRHEMPTKQNIMDGFVRLTQYSQPGDVVFVSFSGHGGRVVDTSGDEDDGFDESLIPVDFQEVGQIVDDDILDIFVKKMKGGVTCTVVMDCCHSGSVMDLPYYFSADGKEMETEKNFQFGSGGTDGEVPKKHKRTFDKHGKAVKVHEKEEQDKAEKKAPKRTVHEAPIKKIKPRAPPRDRKPPPPPPPQRCVIQ